jgi:hypothetical protein
MKQNVRKRRVICIVSAVLAMAYLAGKYWIILLGEDALEFLIQNTDSQARSEKDQV